MQTMSKKAFTLVELIVVITILAILWTIAFISLQWYSRDARDSKRTSDLSNIKTSLEVFNVNTWKYPTPDAFSTISYSWDTVWYQWIIWDQVTTNLKSLNEKPIDPVTKSEYIYSTTSSYKEYEVLGLYEWNIAYNPVINSANAATTTLTPKVVWNYNELFVQTKNYIVPTPSIITSEPWDVVLDWTNIQSQVVTNWTNIPKTATNNTQTWWLDIKLVVFTWNIDKTSTNTEKVNMMRIIQESYNWTSLSLKSPYSYILNKHSGDKLINVANKLILESLNLPPVVYKNVSNCTWTWILYWTEDWTDTWLICWDDIIYCSWSWTWYTIAACNAWANILWFWTGSYWWLYQWWNNANFRWWQFNNTQAYPTSDNVLIPDTTGYNPSTYNNPTIIISTSFPWPFNWTSIKNDDLWGDVTNTNEARKWPCFIWYHVPTYSEWLWLYNLWQWGTNWTNMSNALKLPYAWWRNYNWGSLKYQWNWAYYWTSSANNDLVYKIEIFSNNIIFNSSEKRADSNSIRCFKN